MLSSVSKLVDKAFIIGFLLPALLAVYAAINVLHCAPQLTALCTINTANPFENLTYVALVVWVVAVLLLSFNYGIYRLFEGYSAPISWLTVLKGWHVAQSRRWEDERVWLRTCGDRTTSSNIRQRMLSRYPKQESYFLPTAFGNALRAFEFYAFDIYGIDSITGWDRLQAVIPAAYLKVIGDAQSQVDFFMNSSLLAFLLAVACTVKLVYEHFGWLKPAGGDDVLLRNTALVAIAVAWFAYRASVGQVIEWGKLVKAAFDCYLPALTKQLGYAPGPSEARQREFWADYNQLMVFRQWMPDKKWNRVAVAGPKGSAEDGDSDDDAGEGDGGDDGS